MTLPKTLFVVHELPGAELDAAEVLAGRRAASGTLISVLAVVEGLAARGHPVGVYVLGGQRLVTAADTFDSLDAARRWIGSGRVVYTSCDETGLSALTAAGLRPVVWSHTHFPKEFVPKLGDSVAGVIFVSDLTRLPFLRSRHHRRLGRVHNALHPAFDQPGTGPDERFERPSAIFAGYFGETKGAHRLLQMWPRVRARVPAATLAVCGSPALYHEGCRVGPFGVAEPEFERAYLAPLVERFGSLEAAGIRLTGLLAPLELRERYLGAALGIVNCNWTIATETFCCAGVEMLATGTPVFSFARGALPESLGHTGGAVLAPRPDLDRAADLLADLLCAPARLRALGAAGRARALELYRLDGILDQWERLLAGRDDELYRNSPWAYSRSARYWAERAAGVTGFGSVLDILTGR